MKILKAFCSNTNIHGFTYIVQRPRHKLERMFWLLIIFISFIVTGILIRKLFLESQKNPVVIYTDQNIISVQELNFPAVTMCFGLLYKTSCRTIIDYDKIKTDLEANNDLIKNLTVIELKQLQVASLIARDSFLSEHFPELKIPTDDFMDVLELFNETMNWKEMYHTDFAGNWINQFHIDSKRVLSPYGPCYSFNLPEVETMYQSMSIFNNYTNNRIYRLWPSIQSESDRLQELESYPVKAPNSGEGLWLFFPTSLTCFKKKGFGYFDYQNCSLPSLNTLGYTFRIHDTYEVMSKDASTFTMILHKKIVVEIIPKIYRIDNSLVSENIEIRNCYLPNERRLNFFKVYSKANCEHECLTKMTLETCGCVQFFMARNFSTKICGTSNEKCFRKVEHKFEEVKLSCKCYEPCNNIKYEARLKMAGKYIDKYSPTYDKMSAMITFGTDSIFAIHRKKSKEVDEFFSYIGGILGLLTGFSVISGFEVLYYFLVYPMIEFWKKKSFTRMVYPLDKIKITIKNQSKPKKCWMYVRKLLQGSTIHSFNQFSSNENGRIVRVVWLLIFISSMSAYTLMMKDTYKTFMDTKLVLIMEGSPTTVENIPFPALTLVRDLHMRFGPEYFRFMRNLGYDYSGSFDFSLEILKDMCQDLAATSFFWSETVPFKFENTSNFFDVLDFFTKRNLDWFHDRNASWNGNVEPPFALVLTSTLYGYTFNMVEESMLVNEELISPFLRFNYDKKIYPPFPWRTSADGSNGLSIEVNMGFKEVIYEGLEKAFLSRYCQKLNTMVFHSPFELPLHDEHMTVVEGTAYDVLVIPEIVKSLDDLRAVSLSIRKCYFENERKLKIFKIYTQKNCELECEAFIVYDKCGCILHNMIHSTNATICDNYKIKYCVSDVKTNFKYSSYNHMFPIYGVCGCLPQCNVIKYSYEIYENKFKEGLNQTNNLITMRWKDNEYFAMVRSQQLKVVDFLSCVGGMLGLFAGISALSVVEIFYFLTLRFLSDVIRYFKH